jgi:glucose/arabinose dehydrogenase
VLLVCAWAAASYLGITTMAIAASPTTPTITEPTSEGAIVNPADVHMVVEGYSDPDGSAHACSDWEIWSVTPSEPVWKSPCAGGSEKVHIHLGDGAFINSHAGRSALEFEGDYVLRVRFRDESGEASSWAERGFKTAPAGPAGKPGAVPWAVRQLDYKVEIVASDLQLPVNIAVVPNPGEDPNDPLLYVTELYGTIKVVTQDGTVSDYASGLLNFSPAGGPSGNFPGAGQQGVTGIAVDPVSGDVFASMVYEDSASTADPKPHYPKVVRFHSNDGGLTAATQTTVLDMFGEQQGGSHQVSNLTIGPDGNLYVHTGDGNTTATAQDLGSFRGKVLRMTLGGSPVASNPFYDLADGVAARDYIFAYGFRNPFGGAWRAADGAHYEVENGPSVDRFAKVVSGVNYGWDGTDASMLNSALYNWDPSHAPVNVAFVEPQTASGSGFPIEKMDHAFVTESGPTYATGPQEEGKRIVEFAPQGTGFADPAPLIEYTGVGKASAAGLAAGPDGLYFTDLYKDVDYTSPADRGAHLLRVKYVAPIGITVDDNFYEPDDVTTDFDMRVRWNWDTGGPTAFAHNVRQDRKLFYSGAPTKTDRLTIYPSAGHYHYYCEEHGFGMDGRVKVRPIEDLSNDPVGLPFRVRWARSATQTGRYFAVRFRVDKGSGYGAWRTWKRNSSKNSDNFGVGGKPVTVRSGRTYQFEARTKIAPRSDRKSAWSPILTVGPIS